MTIRLFISGLFLICAGSVGAAISPLQDAAAALGRGLPELALRCLVGSLDRADSGARGDREGAVACLMAARAHAALGRSQPALERIRQGVRMAQTGRHLDLVDGLGREGHAIARDLGEPDLAFRCLAVAQAAHRGRGLAEGEVAKLPPPPVGSVTVEDPTPEGDPPPPEGPGNFGWLVDADDAVGGPWDTFSGRHGVRAFALRVDKDPSMLVTLRRVDEARNLEDWGKTPALGRPGVAVERPKFFHDDMKLVVQAYGFYRFVLKFSRTLDDTFGLAALYVNLTILKQQRNTVFRVGYYATKASTIVEGIRRIATLSRTGTALDLVILATCKSICDIIERSDRQNQQETNDDRKRAERTATVVPPVAPTAKRP